MKSLTAIALFFISAAVFSQTDKIAGEYVTTLGTKGEHYFEYKLTLNEDGTFFFDYFEEKLDPMPQTTKKLYGKGIWKAEGKLITLEAENGKDINEEHSLDFNNTRARFIIKSPRDKSDRVVKTRLQFYKSGIFWMEGIEMEKI